MARVPFKSFNSQNSEMSRLQSNIQDAVQPYVNNALIDGQLVQGQALASGSNSVNHGLGRTLIGWIVTRRNGVATIYDTQASNTSPELTLLLTASATITVDLWVF